MCRLSSVGVASALVSLSAVAIAADGGRPTHVEISPLKFEIGPDGKIETLAMDNLGNLLLGVSWKPESAGGTRIERRNRTAKGEPQPRLEPKPPARSSPSNRRSTFRPDSQRPSTPQQRKPDRKYAIKVISPSGIVQSTIVAKNMVPKMIHGCDDGNLYVAGAGRILRMDAMGRVQDTLLIDRILDGKLAGAHASGITVGKEFVFVALGHGFSLRATEDIVRLNRDLTAPRLIVEKQFGCCSHIDLDLKDDVLLVAENSRHRVNRYSLDGSLLGRWGRRDRTGLEGFAACCNPVNFDMHADGVLYTAESGVGRVKRYSPDGNYLGLVGYVDTTEFDRGSRLAAMSCYIPVEVAPDGKRIYVMDVRANFVRVLLSNELIPRAEAKYVFKQLDADKDGLIDAMEWQRSKGTRQGFEQAGAKIILPSNEKKFVAAYPKKRVFPQLSVRKLQ